ncbi:MAG: 30S ribosomal protein S6 [Desulfobacterium sp.]|nr:30S ribosomal protein S6 [Desulfobacterium sp.]MBU3949532.1 30S ribosomal protein S6 [Pseudomonadota bacterium]MBU4035383.1 30S ribosomal protein S6 [Pseudomonadota bacterium]
MRRYESTVIIDPDIPPENRTPLLEKINEIISQKDGFLVKLNEWGNQKLAYEIMKKNRGYYVHIDYCGTGLLVSEMERFFRIDDRVLKFMTILLEKNVDIEKIKAKMAEVEAEAASSAQANKPENTETLSEENEPEQEDAKTENDSSEKE